MFLCFCFRVTARLGGGGYLFRADPNLYPHPRPSSPINRGVKPNADFEGLNRAFRPTAGIGGP